MDDDALAFIRAKRKVDNLHKAKKLEKQRPGRWSISSLSLKQKEERRYNWFNNLIIKNEYYINSRLILIIIYL